DLLTGQARTLKLTPETAALDASVDKLPVFGTGGSSPALNSIDMPIEAKQSAVARCLALAP
ncbi:hypothetical protein IWW36_006055, partial [Coemansia brasiliensis]